MDWKKIISEITEAGYTQVEIAKIIGVRQPSVSDIATGRTRRPSWEIGDGLMRLHRKVVLKSRAKTAA